MPIQSDAQPPRVVRLVNASYASWRGAVRLMLSNLEDLSGRLDAWTTVADPAQVQRLVFVCLGNINRSAFADAVARGLGARTASLGLSTGTGMPAFEKAICTATRLGVELRTHRATDISDHVAMPGDLLLTMETRHLRQLLARPQPLGQLALLGAWSSPRRLHLHDPHTVGDPYFRTCFTLIQSAVINLTEELRAAGAPCMQP